jgi:predicted PurR-regulated permease PerM
MIMLVAAAGILATLFAVQVVSLTGDLAGYRHNLTQKVRSLAQSAKADGSLKRAIDAVDSIGTEIQNEIDTPRAASNAAANPKMVVKVEDKTGDLIDRVLLAAHPLGQVGLTLLMTLFMLQQCADLRDRILRIAGTDNLSGATAALDDAAGRLSELFLAQALMNIGFGAVVGASLWMIGVPNSLLWGGLAILMRFVPYVGSFIAAIPPILLAVAVDPSWGMAIAVLVIFLIGEPLMGHVIEPLLLGPKAGLSPFAMLASAAFWALVWGPIGLILAAPLTLTMVVVGRHVNGLKFMTVLLGDEPALSPEQQFYHRLLASDALGAAQLLEKASVDKSLIEIGDRIVLPALHLAAADFDRHQFDREQAQSILDTSIETSRLFEPARTDGEAKVTSPSDRLAGPRHASILLLPVRTQLDIAAVEFIDCALEAVLPLTATATAKSAGLTAISQAAGSVTDAFSAVVLVTAGGNDTQYLPLIARRAQKAFPSAQINLLDVSGAPVDRAAPASTGKTIKFTKLAELVQQLRHVNSTRVATVS